MKRPGESAVGTRRTAQIDDIPSITLIGSESIILYHAPAKAAVVLDLGKTSAFSSATFVTLIRAKRALQQSGGELHIADVPPKVMKVLTDLRLSEVLNLHPRESATEMAGQLKRDRIQ
jgi:anti-anti-sigma regulatory factor